MEFASQATADLFNGISNPATRKLLPESLVAIARRKLDLLNAAVALSDLRVPPGNRLEVLKGDRQGQYSIRLNRQYRICFAWTDAGPVAVEIVDYH